MNSITAKEEKLAKWEDVDEPLRRKGAKEEAMERWGRGLTAKEEKLAKWENGFLVI